MAQVKTNAFSDVPFCRWCFEPIERKAGESDKSYQMRKFCSKQCAGYHKGEK